MKEKIQVLFFVFIAFFNPVTYGQHIVQGEFIYGDSGTESAGPMVGTADGGYIMVGSTIHSLGYLLKIDGDANLVWSKQFGGPSDNGATSITKCRDGNYIFTGYTGDYGAGNDDMYVVKIDPNGNFIWTKTIGEVEYDYGYSIIQSKDGGYAIAGSSGVADYDVFIVKLDSTGGLQWSKTVGGGSGDDQGYSIIQSRDGDFVIAGRTNSFGSGNYDVYIIKVSNSGNLVWTRTIGGSGDDEGRSIIQCNDGGFAIGGYTGSFGAGSNDMYVVKLDSTGKLLWTKTIGGTMDDRGSCIIENRNGGLTITGSTNSFGPGIGANVYTVCLDKSGNLLWTKAVGGTYEDAGSTIIQCSDGGYAIGGGSNSFGVGGYYAYFLKTDSLGNLCSDTGSGGLISTGGTIDSGGTMAVVGTASSGGTDTAILTLSEELCQVLGVPQISSNSLVLNLQPNPCTNILNIATENQTNLSSIQISDITGRVLLTYDLSQMTYNYSLDVSGLSSGMYFLRINSSNGTEIKKFIKE